MPVVYQAASRAEAEWIRSVLKENGVEAWVVADDVGGMDPQLLMTGRAQVQVRVEDNIAAQQILRSIQPEEGEEEI